MLDDDQGQPGASANGREGFQRLVAGRPSRGDKVEIRMLALRPGPRARVFAIDVNVCRKCGIRMRVLNVMTDPDDIARILHGARGPPRPPRSILLARFCG